MKTTIDLRSMIVGVIGGAVLTLVLGAANGAPATPIGRYQMDVGSDHGLVLDTATGQVWSARLSGASRTDKEFFKAKGTPAGLD